MNPLFFFISGCTMNFDKSGSIRAFIVKRIKTLLIPCFAFALLSLVLKTIETSLSLNDILNYLPTIALGCIRNTYFASSLWFLSALFVLEIVFILIKKLKYPIVIIVLSVAAFFICGNIVDTIPEVGFVHFLNWDWALYYLLYFVIGFYSYSLVTKLFKLDSNAKRIIFTVLFVTCSAVAVLTFERKSFITCYVSNEYALNIIYMIRTLVLIVFNLCVARLLHGIPLLSEIGKESLFLCGNEWIIKTGFYAFTCVFGLTTELANPLVAYIYTFVIIIAGTKILIPFEKTICKTVRLDLLSSKQ